MLKKFIISLVILCSSVLSVQAQAYCVITTGNKRVIAEENMHQKQSVASISKIMTAVIAIEKGNLDETWTVTKEILKVNGSSIYLKPGQKVSLKSLLYGLMLRSGNDAAVEIALMIAGDIETFVKMMNEKAKEIGMQNTFFNNPSGLDDDSDGNISTPYDMALLMSYAMQLPIFQEINRAKFYDTEWNYRWMNKNKLLFQYDKATGGKTGFTEKAGRTLVTSAAFEGLETIVVTFNVKNDFDFHKNEHERVFQNYSAYKLIDAGSYTLDKQTYVIDSPIFIPVKKEGEDLMIRSNLRDGKFIIEVGYDDASITQPIIISNTNENNNRNGWLF